MHSALAVSAMTTTSVCDSKSLQACYKKALTAFNLEITPRENSITKKVVSALPRTSLSFILSNRCGN